VRCAFSLLLLACSLPAAAAERPEDFAYAVPVEIGAGEALQRLEIPQAVYGGSVEAYLADLRVFNGRGEIVPFAFLPRAVPESAESDAVPLRFFPLHGLRGTAAQDLDVRAERTADGTVVRVRSSRGSARERVVLGYLVDASEHKTPLRTLELDWKPAADGFNGTLRVEGSDDLARWTTLAAAAPLLSLQFAGERLEQKSVELPGVRSRYLRLSWPAQQPALELQRLHGRPGLAQVEPERRWSPAAITTGSKAAEYLFDLGGDLPVDRLRIELPEPNSLVAVDVLARRRPEDAWQSVARGVVYRLTRESAEVVSPPLHVAAFGRRYWLLRVDQKGGGLGTEMPAVQAGWVPQEIVFVARGEAPFQLAYGSSGMQRSAYPVETVVPGWRPDEPLPAAHARTGEQRELAGPAALRERLDYKTWLLWGALALGVAILAWMAWQLARQMPSGEQP
jgi:hypothetical protein